MAQNLFPAPRHQCQSPNARHIGYQSEGTRAAGRRVLKNALMLAAAVFCILSAHTLPAGAATPAPSDEYRVKAAFLLNFAMFVDWPPGTVGRELIIGIIGEDPFASTINSLKGKTVKGIPVVIRRYDSVGEALEAHILYISPSERQALGQILKTTRGKPVLTVGDSRGFMRSGVMINMLVIQKRIGFEINNQAANQAGLHISSHLLKLAKEVVEP